MSYTVRALEASTWDAFAELVERNNGIFGGCWCIGYHPECGERGIDYRTTKEALVRGGRARAALVLDEAGLAQGWCQYGDPDAVFARAKDLGARVIRDLEDTAYGSRDFSITDPEGNRWSFGTYAGSD